MIKSFKIRLEPNNKQLSKLFQCTGTARWAYNWTLGKQQDNYKKGEKFLQDNDLRKELTQLKKTDELKWLNQYSNNITKQAIKDACDAYISFFKGQTEFPKFKSKKKSTPSFYVDNIKIQFTDTHVKLEKLTDSLKKIKQKFNWIKLSEANRMPLNAKYMNPRVTFDGLHWYISVSVEIKSEKQDLTNESIGIDLGIKDLAIVSNIEKPFKNINKTKRIRQLEKRLKRLQKQCSRKYEMNKIEVSKNKFTFIKTKNIIKLEQKIRIIYKKLANIRTDYRHKVTTTIVKTKPCRIVMEDLNIKGMIKNKHLSKAIVQQGFYEFMTMIQYKCNKYGIEFVKADRWYPSSKLCSECGAYKKDLKLKDRIYVCPECGCCIDRDKNASINLSNYGKLA